MMLMAVVVPKLFYIYFTLFLSLNIHTYLTFHTIDSVECQSPRYLSSIAMHIRSFGVLLSQVFYNKNTMITTRNRKKKRKQNQIARIHTNKLWQIKL